MKKLIYRIGGSIALLLLSEIGLRFYGFVERLFIKLLAVMNI